MELYYRQQGEGTPLLLLHGNGEDGSYFHHQMAHFSKFFRVIAVDTRGHGRSPRGTEPFTIRQFAEDLRDFMDRQQISKAHILGFSDGGNFALIFAMRYPERVDRLILNGANLHGRGVRPLVQLPIVAGYHIASLFANRSEEAKRNAEMLGLMVNDPNLSAAELAAVQARTLVIAGTRDMIRRRHTQEIAAAIPGAELVFLPGDHFIAAKSPQAFNREVERFLMEP